MKTKLLRRLRGGTITLICEAGALIAAEIDRLNNFKK